MALIVGIDLGTTYSVVAYIDEKTKAPVIIKNKYGNPTTPSAVGFNKDGSYVIGEDAKNMEEMGDVNTASFYKLHMGDHKYKYSFFGKDYTAGDLSALYLKRLIEEAQRTVGDKITKAVITVPAYFEDAAKNDTLNAGKAAGLNVLNIINEPTAACIAYGLRSDGAGRKILIYDLGGGTFDVTVARVGADSIDVIGTTGHHRLGGRDWDSAVADWITEQFEEETGIDLSEDSEMAATLMVKAEKAKRELTVAGITEISVDNGERKCRFKLTRDDFEAITAFQLGVTTDLIDQLFRDIRITWRDIDGAVLVGGSTKMPMVKNFITKNGITVLDGVHPDESVAVGAAIQANISSVCATLPGKKELSSLGMKRNELDLTLLPGAKMVNDVIPHSLGMISESHDGERFVNDIMIPKNTPCANARETKRRELRVSKKKERNRLDIYLLQGESERPENCSVAKKYCFNNIDYVEGGKTVIDITFLHTINGTIDIKAVQTETGRELRITEEEIPEDMSWVSRSPKEYMSENAVPISGALIMALDLSGSMGAKTKGVMAIDRAADAMINFAEQFSGTDIKIGIIGFSDSTRVMCKPTTDIKHVIRAIKSLKIGLTGNCNDADPTREMYKELSKFRGEPFLYALVLTDGEWMPDAQRSAKAMKKRFVGDEMEIIGMGFGTADRAFLKAISTRDDLADVSDITNLSSGLSSIAKVILN